MYKQNVYLVRYNTNIIKNDRHLKDIHHFGKDYTKTAHLQQTPVNKHIYATTAVHFSMFLYTSTPTAHEHILWMTLLICAL